MKVKQTKKFTPVIILVRIYVSSFAHNIIVSHLHSRFVTDFSLARTEVTNGGIAAGATLYSSVSTKGSLSSGSGCTVRQTVQLITM